MKPSSGVKPPWPIMTMSPFSRELTVTLGSDAARASSALSASPSSNKGSQTAAAVRIDQSHAEPPQNMVFREGRKVNKSPIPADAIISIWG
jgi:hypothetical protein